MIINLPNLRNLVLSDSVNMLKHIAAMSSMLSPPEVYVRDACSQPAQFDLAVKITNFVLQELGAPPPQVKDARFDKTRRQAAKKLPKPPRGVPKKAAAPAIAGRAFDGD